MPSAVLPLQLSIHRRAALRVVAAGAAWAAWPAARAAGETTAGALAAHVLQRFAYGPRPGDLARVHEQGVDAWLDAQFTGAAADEGPEVAQALESASTLRQSHVASIAQFVRRQQGERAAASDEERAQLRAQVAQHVRSYQAETRQLRLLRALHSPQQLREVMVEFWFNHFNVFGGKELARVTVGHYEAEAIRPHVFGRFRDMLGATAKHPAMLVYLDNAQSVADGFGARRPLANASGLNENYARELLELHTLGVDGGYTQADVRELARVLTGWTIDRRADEGDSAFRFAPGRHDNEPKRLLGQDVPGRGVAQGEWALDLLARHPSTARHIAAKLARSFVADTPPAGLVQRLADSFRATDGDLRELVRTLARSPEFRDPQVFGAKFKTPYQYVLSAVRASGAPMREPRLLVPALAQMGMPLYGCVTPDGFKDVREAWLSADALSKRVEFAQAVAQRLAARDTLFDAQGVLNTLGPAIGATTRAAVNEASGAQRLAVLFASPDFMRR